MKTMIGFDITNPSFDKGKYIRQLRSVVKWKKAKARGTAECATGYGKTAVAMIAIAKLLKKSNLHYNNSVLVVVPTIKLKEQWQGLMNERGWSHVEVQVINTVVLTAGFTRNVDLLILDRKFVEDKLI